MAIPHAKPGEIVDVRPLGSALALAQTATLLRAEQVEVRRFVVPAGKEIAEHKAKGEIVVYCLEGKVRTSGQKPTSRKRKRRKGHRRLRFRLVGAAGRAFCPPVLNRDTCQLDNSTAGSCSKHR